MAINVTNQAPAPTTPLAAGVAVSFDVTFDPTTDIQPTIIKFDFGTSTEVVYDSSGFLVPYAGSSQRDAIAGGFHYTVRRSGNWPASPAISVLGVVESDAMAEVFHTSNGVLVAGKWNWLESAVTAMTLPLASAGPGRPTIVAKWANANAVTVTRAGSDSLSGGTVVTFDAGEQYQVKSFYASVTLARWAAVPGP